LVTGGRMKLDPGEVGRTRKKPGGVLNLRTTGPGASKSVKNKVGDE